VWLQRFRASTITLREVDRERNSVELDSPSKLDSSVFGGHASAQSLLDHIEDVYGGPIPSGFLNLFADNPDPQLALGNLFRWLSSTANPQIHLQHIFALPKLAGSLLLLLGASQPMADMLIQNPELASLVLDPSELGVRPNRARIEREGRTLVSAVTSQSHAIDRLRFLKQRWTLPIVVNDLCGNWQEEWVWKALSDLAEALVNLCAEVVWRDFAQPRGLAEECPVLIVGFGKLGGGELNLSSDIDLAYCIPDARGEQFETDVARFCEILGRALSDRMGRGSLYRVDLRLRPYGSAGPLVSTMRAYENYYRLYAEQWEVQALLKSSPISGPGDLQERWRSMRKAICFRPHLSEMELESMLEMKTRIEERSEFEDLKRGAGGIRDVEFLVQALQLLHGHRLPQLQTPETLAGLRRLEEHGVLDHAVAISLEAGYVFLRQIEHRCQLVGDQQTHSIPAQPQARERLAKLMGRSTWPQLESELDRHRRTIQTLYNSILRPEQSQTEDRDLVSQKLNQVGPSVLQWFDSMEGGSVFYASLAQNQDSLVRVEKVALFAPRLVADFKSSIELTELLISGEIEEDLDPVAGFDRMNPEAELRAVAEAYRRAKTLALARWVLLGNIPIAQQLTRIADAVLVYFARRLNCMFDVIGLGSLGAEEMGFDSDADLLLLVEDGQMQSGAEHQAQQFLAMFGQLERAGCNLDIDLRLRPDGGKGMLVRSLEAIGAYELSGMEMWERFALGPARLIYGGSESLRTVRKAAYALPLTPERLGELLAMKKRVENERVPPQHLNRNVKLGHGGLNDLEWLVHLFEMRYPTATQAVNGGPTHERIRRLGNAGLLNAVEVDQLSSAMDHLSEVRLRISLLGMEQDVLPENPDKLLRLAQSMQIPSGNEFLAIHRRISETVRSVYLLGLERLNA
jgi:[glutamine synthetase] adenylyltransferase / [glutamine synthetase]-adenylyl-L-tyrosine phosphorylase